jgi:hypothetical protein
MFVVAIIKLMAIGICKFFNMVDNLWLSPAVAYT